MPTDTISIRGQLSSDTQEHKYISPLKCLFNFTQ